MEQKSVEGTDMDELSERELEMVNGGSYATAREYMQELMEKYGVDTQGALKKLMTDEEWNIFFKKLEE